MCLALLGGSSCRVKPLCPPTEGRVGFFSRGDCVLARAAFFQGHELLTYFGNRDLPENDRFSDEDVELIADGNRRVDWPLEMLVHLNNGVAAYAEAIVEHTAQPAVQKSHFLLSDTNSTPEAVAAATEEVLQITIEAVEIHIEQRERSLVLLGQANHTFQDSFSPAHTVRNVDAEWCIEKVKAYIPRAEGFLTADIEFHGSHEDTIGHITTEDSIYREGRDCHEPESAAAKEACLSTFALRGRLATRDYLRAVRRVLALAPAASRVDQVVRRELSPWVETHLSLCEESTNL